MSMTPAPVTPASLGHTPNSQAEAHTSPPAGNAARIRCSLSPAISAARSPAQARPTAHTPIMTGHLLPPSPQESASRDWTQRPSGPGPPSLSSPTLLQRQLRGADAPSRCRLDQDDLARSADRGPPVPANNRQGSLSGYPVGSPPGSFLTAWRRTSADLAEPPLRHPHGRPPGARDSASRLVHAGMNGEDFGQVDNGKNPQHLVLRRGQQQVTPGAPRLHPPEHQPRPSAAADELQTAHAAG